MEEILIYKVEERRVLYDTNLVCNKDYRARNVAWEEIAAELGLSVSECRDMWARLRNSYNNALKRRVRQRYGTNKSYGKWKYEDQMSFLIPYKGVLGESVTTKYTASESPRAESDINYTIDESVTNDSIFDDGDSGDCEITSDNVCASLSPIRFSKDTTGNSDPLTTTTSSNPLVHYEESVTVAVPDEPPLVVEEYDFSKQEGGIITSAKEKNTPFSYTATSSNGKVITDNKNSRNVVTLVIKKPSIVNKENDNQYDLIEEEYYLRLARMARKLKPSDRIKLRDRISKVVMDALISSLPEN